MHMRVLVYDVSRTYRSNDIASIDAATLALVHLCTQATAVQEVLIHAEGPLKFDDALRTVAKMASAATAQLAASALQLQTLKCYFGIEKLSSFPSMFNLKL
ncbi:hypothetical protein COCOBI_18-0550 [Coccomyxa sp. Obi]|nr:hypothetical protein COCOBI_18-0550 [Coccomyxa sp. Obi]